MWEGYARLTEPGIGDVALVPGLDRGRRVHKRYTVVAATFPCVQVRIERGRNRWEETLSAKMWTDLYRWFGIGRAVRRRDRTR